MSTAVAGTDAAGLRAALAELEGLSDMIDAAERMKMRADLLSAYAARIAANAGFPPTCVDGQDSSPATAALLMTAGPGCCHKVVSAVKRSRIVQCQQGGPSSCMVERGAKCAAGGRANAQRGVSAAAATQGSTGAREHAKFTKALQEDGASASRMSRQATRSGCDKPIASSIAETPSVARRAAASGKRSADRTARAAAHTITEAAPETTGLPTLVKSAA